MGLMKPCDFIENIKEKAPCKCGRPVNKMRDQAILQAEVIHLDCITNQTNLFTDAIECIKDKKLDNHKLKLLVDVGPALLLY